MLEIWLWQQILTPHITELAVALARLGCDVTYVASRPMSQERLALGWTPPDVAGVRVELASDAMAVTRLVASAGSRSVHICSGIRSNGLVQAAQVAIAARGLRQWALMETVDDAGWRGVLKRLEYTRLFSIWRSKLEGVLTNGHQADEWVVRRGMPESRVFPFAYFLSQPGTGENPMRPACLFRFVYVGQLIKRKQVDTLLNALALLQPERFELVVVGAGEEATRLRALAAHKLPGCVQWLDSQPRSTALQLIAGADCLVLPSRFDGWGAVASEALLVGTPAVVSRSCGVAGVVEASGRGGIFEPGDTRQLAQLLREQLALRSKQEDRTALRQWARCLSAEAGATYLIDILNGGRTGGERPIPPWCSIESKLHRAHVPERHSEHAAE